LFLGLGCCFTFFGQKRGILLEKRVGDWLDNCISRFISLVLLQKQKLFILNMVQILHIGRFFDVQLTYKNVLIKASIKYNSCIKIYLKGTLDSIEKSIILSIYWLNKAFFKSPKVSISRFKRFFVDKILYGKIYKSKYYIVQTKHKFVHRLYSLVLHLQQVGEFVLVKSVQIRISVSQEINSILSRVSAKLGKNKSMLVRELMEQKMYDLGLIQRGLKDLQW
jgi:predicted DNA-binding protein